MRTTPRDPGRNRRILLVVAGSAALIAAAVLGFLLFGGGGGGDDKAATSVAAKFRELGGTFQTYPALPNLRYKGQRVRHVPAMPPGYKYNSNPPSSGVHTDATVIWGIYDEPIATISSVHNLEHGGIVIRYGPDVPAADVEKLREFYIDDPNGLIVAPMPGLGDDIALTAWTYDRGRQNDRSYEGEGRVAKLDRFDEDAFSAFVDKFRGHGPENPPFTVADLEPGGQ